MSNRPNILFIFSDQQHWRAAGFEDASFQTPNLDRLASQGMVFGNAFCTTPQCSPSRSSILTGLYPSRTGVWGNIGAAGGNPLRTPTIGAALQKAGYRTAYFGKWHLGKDPLGTAGWDEDFGVTGPETTDDPEVTRRALRFLDRHRDGDGPFALFLSYNNPHDIYHFRNETNPHPFRPMELPPSWSRQDFSSVPRVHAQFMREDQGRIIVNAESPAWQRYRELYREKTALYDTQLGQVLGVLEDRGVLNETLVVVTSDHGDMETHHRLIYKGPFMYEQMMRVPLIIRSPGVAPNTSRAPGDFLTVNVDLAPTLAEYAGVSALETDGISLKPILDGKPGVPAREFVVGQYYSKQKWVNPIRMICDNRCKYVLYREHGEELYDLANDPSEIHNCAHDPAYAGVKAALSVRLKDWIRRHSDPFFSLSPTTRDGTRIQEPERTGRGTYP